MLNKKIAVAEQQVAKQQEEQAAEKEEKQSSDTTGEITKSVVKVLTSATFIRGAFSVLSKLMRK